MELRQGLQGKSKIQKWANCYDISEDTCIENLVCEVKKRGYLKKPELVRLAKWKLSERWQRGEEEGKLGLVKQNSPNDVRRITYNAFQATDSSDSIRCLRCLEGVDWAVGSAILHWFHKCRYPIWDIHARWSVKLPKYQFYCGFKRWKVYVNFCRAEADKYEVCMRTLDRALITYGKNNC